MDEYQHSNAHFKAPRCTRLSVRNLRLLRSPRSLTFQRVSGLQRASPSAPACGHVRAAALACPCRRSCNQVSETAIASADARSLALVAVATRLESGPLARLDAELLLAHRRRLDVGRRRRDGREARRSRHGDADDRDGRSGVDAATQSESSGSVENASPACDLEASANGSARLVRGRAAMRVAARACAAPCAAATKVATSAIAASAVASAVASELPTLTSTQPTAAVLTRTRADGDRQLRANPFSPLRRRVSEHVRLSQRTLWRRLRLDARLHAPKLWAAR